MAKTFEEMKAAIADWVGNANTTRLPTSVRGDLVNIKIKELGRKYDFRWLETTAAARTLVAGAHTLALPTRFSHPYVMRLQSGTDVYEVEQLTYSELRARFPDPANDDTGTPGNYAVYGEYFYFSCRADVDYTVLEDYFVYLDDLADGAPANTNKFIEIAWDVVLFGVLADCSLYGIEDARIGVFQSKYENLLSNLISEHARARSSGRPAIAEEPG